MTDAADWPQANDAFLSAALSWLRLRLERLPRWGGAPRPPPRPPPPPGGAPPPQAASFRERFLRRGPAEAAPPILALPPASEAVTEAQIADAAKAMAAAEESD